MDFSSACILLLSCMLLLSPLSASPLLSGSIQISQSKSDTGVSLFTSIDGFQPPDSADIGENFAKPAPTSYQGDILGSPPADAPDNGNADFLPFVPPQSASTDDATPPEMPVPPPTGDAPLPTPQFPIILPPPSDNLLPLSPQFPVALPPTDSSPHELPQLPIALPPTDSLTPESPQLPIVSSPPLYNTLPGSPYSPLPYHHPKDTQPETSTAPAPFGVYPSGENQAQQFGQSNSNSGLFGQQQSSNDVPFGGQYGGSSSIRDNLVRTIMALIGVLLISWV
jgi:hypothetical protein